MDYYIICYLVSESLHGWKYKNDDDTFWTGFVTPYGVVGFKLDMFYWDGCMVPIIHSKPNLSKENSLEILKKCSETNLRFATKEMHDEHYKVLNEEILSKMESDSEINAYLSFYEPTRV